jgi:hypothetical protein
LLGLPCSRSPPCTRRCMRGVAQNYGDSLLNSLRELSKLSP